MIAIMKIFFFKLLVRYTDNVVMYYVIFFLGKCYIYIYIIAYLL